MKIAVFATCWNEEGLRFYCDGFKNWAMDRNAIVDIYTCYGTIGIEDKFNIGEYKIYDLPELTEYDGVVLVESTINEPAVRQHLYELVHQEGIPCVTIDNQVEGFSSIGIDQKFHMCQLTEHLITEHHATELCYIGAPRQSVEAESRLEGFLLAMEKNHLTIHPEWMYEKTYEYQDGMDVVQELYHADNMPQAFVCANDDMATGVCDALIARGIQVGKDVLVTGFDNYFLGENYSPRLTTARRPRESITYRACEMIINQKKTGHKEVNVFQQGNIVLGETCGCQRELCGDHREFRRTIFQREHNRRYVDILLADMEEKIISGEDLESVISNVGNMLNSLAIGRCRIMLTPDADQVEQVAHQSYRDCTRSCLVWNNAIDNEASATVEGHAYIYTPIHFQEHIYGYCVFQDIEQLMADRELFKMVRSIGFSIENVTQKKRYERLNAKLETLYETDSLTGTYNRHGMHKLAEPFLESRRVNKIPVDIIFVDIDYLKSINDTYGHEEGDYTIQIVGKSLLHFQNEHCKVFRYGGDEFIMLRESRDDFVEFAAQIKEQMQRLQKNKQKPFTVSASIGYVTAQPTEKIPLQQYIQKADNEMYLIKKGHHVV